MSISAQLTVVEVEDATNTFQPIGCITSIDGFDGEAPEIDITCP